MKNFKTLGLATALAAASLAVVASGAAASTFTSPFGTAYAKEIVATSTNMELSGSFKTVECSYSAFEVDIEKDGSDDAGGDIESLTFSGCNYTISVNSHGSMDVDSNRNVDLFNTQFSVETSVGTCVFTASGLFGTKIGALTEGSGAVIDFYPGEIPRTGGNFLCGKVGHWTGSYEVTTPGALWIK